MPGVVLEDVSKRFAGAAAAAVEGVSLAVEDGEFVTLLGPSGCGKTTTLRMIAGLEQNDTGRIRIGDRLVSDAAAGTFVTPDRRNLGMVFQSYAIWPHMTVFDNVAYPLRVRSRPAAEIADKVREALRLVEMEPFAQRPAPALSGGQQQRVAIARALVFHPDVLLLDEPLSNLDARLRVQTGGEFRSLQQRLGITSVYVTHDQEEAMALSDRIVVMAAGRILQVGTPEAIYQRPASREVAAFFGSPNLLPGRVASANGELLAVEGEGWQGVCRAGAAFSPGEGVLVMIRPESFQLRAAGGAGISVTGKVVQSVFHGARRSLGVQADGLLLHAEASALQAPAIGENVTLAARAEDCWALRREEAGT